MGIFSELKEALPKTTERVAKNTRAEDNRKIREMIERRIHEFADHPEDIPKRLDELDREWDVERILEANAATLALVGTLLGFKDKRFLTLPLLVTGFLLQHALQGWCPPLPILRRLGVRTETEIMGERNSLKAMYDAFANLETRPH